MPAFRAVSTGRGGGAAGGGDKSRIGGFLLLMVIGVGFPVFFFMKGFGKASADEQTPLVEARERYTGAGLADDSPRFAEPLQPEVRRPEPTPAPTPPPPAPAPAPVAEKPRGFDLELARLRSSGSLAVVKAMKEEASTPTGASAGPLMRHVPRGTVLPAFLESRVVSDNLDSRARAVLLEDFRLRGDVILPKDGYFIGNAASLDSRYQSRVAVRVTNFIYPDREREVSLNGLLLNPDESAHLMADDVNHHGGKLIAGIVGLELLRAAAGAIGGYDQGNRVAVSFGSGVGSTASDVFEPSLEKLTEILPTITVEPGKPVLVFVEDSFDVPEYAELPTHYSTPAAKQGEDAATSKDGQLEATLERLTEAMKSAERMQSLPAPPPLGPMGQ